MVLSAGIAVNCGTHGYEERRMGHPPLLFIRAQIGQGIVEVLKMGMPGRAMTGQLGLTTGAEALLVLHPTLIRFLLLAVIFLFGYLEGAVFEKRDLACATWFWGLAALTAWIVYPGTAIRVYAGIVVFVSGVFILIVYYRRRVPRF